MRRTRIPQADGGRERESSEFKRNLNGGPQADDGGEQVSINDGRLMINDFVHTENTEGYGGPQADFVGKQQLSSIGQQLKEKYFF